MPLLYYGKVCVSHWKHTGGKYNTITRTKLGNGRTMGGKAKFIPGKKENSRRYINNSDCLSYCVRSDKRKLMRNGRQL